MVFKCTNRSLNLDHAFYGTPISLFRMMQCISIQGWFHITRTHENILLKVVLLIWFYLHWYFHGLRTICHSDLFFLLLITLYYLKFDILRSLHYNIFREIRYFKNVFQILSSDTWNKIFLESKMRFSSSDKFSVFAKVLYYCKTISNL